MYTYIFKSHDLYKIGRSQNVEKRIVALRIGNPHIELLKVIKGDCEKCLHGVYRNKRVGGEWFRLDEYDLSKLDELAEFILDPTKVYARIYEPVAEWRKTNS